MIISYKMISKVSQWKEILKLKTFHTAHTPLPPLKIYISSISSVCKLSIGENLDYC